MGITDQLASGLGDPARPIPYSVNAPADAGAGFQHDDLELTREQEGGRAITTNFGRDRGGRAVLDASQSSIGNRRCRLLMYPRTWSFRSVPEIREPYRRCRRAKRDRMSMCSLGSFKCYLINDNLDPAAVKVQ